MAGSSRTQLAFRVLLCCALAATVTIVLPLALRRPCAYSPSRTILAATGLDPQLISCTGDAATKAPMSGGGGDARNKVGTGGGRPIITDLRWCGEPSLPSHALPPFRCCPPTPPATEPAVINFTFPDPGDPLRTRRPAHDAGADMTKLARAVALMKALPASDPRSFYQQAKVHCAYCAGAYRQAGRRPELAVQIHYSWLFFPFHRAYLYFFERIAARLLEDPGFALPFWGWDVPEGMQVPPEFADEASPLYDPVRNPRHAPPRLVDLDFSYVEENRTDEQQVQLNLRTVYKQMVTNAPLPSLFLGQPYRAGDREMPGAGTVELSLHNIVHRWTGDLARPNHENMGSYYSSARDPIFFPHHANSDRLWEVWRDGASEDRPRRRRHRHVDFADPDWLDSSFLFYDEEARLVRVTVRDMLDIGKLRYTYAGVGTPWLSARPPVTQDGSRGGGQELNSIRFPVSLDAAVSAVVMRPGSVDSRGQHEVEVLVVEGIEADAGDFVRFDVIVNAVEHEKVGPGAREVAGSFVSLKQTGMVAVETSMRVALDELLQDLGAEGDDSVTVTLVPVMGRVRIGGLRIEHIVE